MAPWYFGVIYDGLIAHVLNRVCVIVRACVHSLFLEMHKDTLPLSIKYLVVLNFQLKCKEFLFNLFL